MPNKKAKTNLPTTTGEFAEFLIPKEIATIEKRIEEQFPQQLVKILSNISYQVAEIGLSEKEACLISDYPHDMFVKLKERYSIVVELMSVKDLEYKKSLLKHISKKAKDGDDKVAQWLLMAKYGDEYNLKKGTGKNDEGDDANLVAMGLEFVRTHGDANDMVTKESGRAFIIKKGGNREKKDSLADIKQLLK